MVFAERGNWSMGRNKGSVSLAGFRHDRVSGSGDRDMDVKTGVIVADKMTIRESCQNSPLSREKASLRRNNFAAILPWLQRDSSCSCLRQDDACPSGVRCQVTLSHIASRQIVAWLAILLMLVNCSGCSLFVMAGKALFGDPKVPAEFRTITGTDLTTGDDAVVIICSMPHGIQSAFPSLQIDVVDRVTRNLESRNIKVVPSGDVASWFDDHGEWGDYSELAEAFDAQFVIHVDIREFHCRVPESENLLQGKSEGKVSVYQVSSSNQLPLTSKKYQAPVSLSFDRDFNLMFPTSYPVPRETRSEDLFVQGFMDRLALHISQHFYDYRMSETIH